MYRSSSTVLQNRRIHICKNEKKEKEKLKTILKIGILFYFLIEKYFK